MRAAKRSGHTRFTFALLEIRPAGKNAYRAVRAGEASGRMTVSW